MLPVLRVLRPLILVGSCLFAGATCKKAPVDVSRLREPGWENTPRGSDDAIVAKVAGRPIFVSDVAAQVRETGQGPRAALESLIDFEVLAGAARDRALGMTDEIARSLRQQMVSRLLAETFEPAHEVTDIPEGELRVLYEKNRQRFDHPRAVEYRYLLVRIGPDRDRDAVRREAQDLKRDVDRAMAQARGKPKEAFARIRKSAPWAQKGIGFRGDFAVTTDDPLHRAVMALPDHAVSDVVEVETGAAIALRIREIPARHESFEMVRDQIARAYYETWVLERFRAYTGRLAEASGAKTFDQRVAALFRSSGN